MTKRKLTRRQSWRAKKIQAERKQRAEKFSSEGDKALQNQELSPEQEGLFVAHFGQTVEIEDLTGQTYRCKLRSNLPDLVAGDKIIFRADSNDTGVVVAHIDRTNVLARPDLKGDMQVVAANLNQILMVIAPEPMPNATTVDRYLAVAELLDIPPVIIVNKSDLVNGDTKGELYKKLDMYRDLGYPWIEASTKTMNGLDKLQTILDHKTSVFVGQSGVGKSSLIAKFISDTDIRIGAVSTKSRRGQHTTTTARLYHLAQGGMLIDSPGVRQFGLWHLSLEKLARGFIEFQPYLGQCKFRDCLHGTEPGCAIVSAVKQGKISPKRLEHFHSLVRIHT